MHRTYLSYGPNGFDGQMEYPITFPLDQPDSSNRFNQVHATNSVELNESPSPQQLQPHLRNTCLCFLCAEALKFHRRLRCLVINFFGARTRRCFEVYSICYLFARGGNSFGWVRLPHNEFSRTSSHFLAHFDLLKSKKPRSQQINTRFSKCPKAQSTKRRAHEQKEIQVKCGANCQ